MTTELTRFQDGFARALTALAPPPDLRPAVRAAAERVAFAVYRNTVMKGWVDALAANYPAVQTLVGEDWFRAAAARFARAEPARSPALVLYGAGFPDFLRTFEPARELPYLADVAAMDRLWSEAHVAADAGTLAGDALAALAPETLAATRLRLHPSVRFAWFETSAPSVWLQARGFLAEEAEPALEARAEGVLAVRADAAVAAFPLSAGGFALLSSIRDGEALGTAADAAAQAEPDLDLARLFAALISAGVFADATAP